MAQESFSPIRSDLDKESWPGPGGMHDSRDCPGTKSEQAGKASACEGCPNQSVCASGPKGPDPALLEIRDRLATVKHKILVLSGKGGVGKSTVSSQLAFSLAAADYQVGLLDIDICGPSIPKMMGLEGELVHDSSSGWSPVYVDENLAVMSIGFMVQDEQSITWRGPRKNGMIARFLKDVDWGELDVLLVDTPPGTSDEHLSIVSYLKEVGVDGAIVVTTPQEVALLDVRKEITFCKKVGIPILGVVENMAGFVCPGCKHETQIFKPSTGGARKMAEEMGVPFLVSIPIDPTLRAACDEGKSFAEVNPTSPATLAFQSVCGSLKSLLV